MNKDQAEGKWEQLKGEMKRTWGKLTDNDLTAYKGDTQKFYGLLKERYGLEKEEAERRVKEMEKKYSSDDSRAA